MDKRSPIRSQPLRAPGQSLQEKRHDLFVDGLLRPALIAIVMIALWLQDLWRTYYPARPVPWLTGTIAAIAIVYAAWEWRRALKQVNRLTLAIEGERSVGQGLEKLRTQGYQVLHDIVGGDFNIDHLIVGPAGIFTIETKTMRKRPGTNPVVGFDGLAVTINGRPAIKDPIAQARAQARWVSEFLSYTTSRTFEVRPVIVYPGWFVETTGKAPDQLWVINEKALPAFLAHEREWMNASDIALVAEALATFVRARAAAEDF